jgi:taurine-pyruvate aminotransferase
VSSSVSSEEVEDRERREPAMTDKVGKAISNCKEREPIVGKNGDTIAGYNNMITLAPTPIVSDDDLALVSGILKESLYVL